ncbi:hypothetical protein ACI703_10150 [Isoptericola jiangsuensis]|uniref:hypothetical protein n=1 Tax=Isoptericola jiangsuensis TaxID=548579 RepID=UPI003869B2C4
MRQTFDGGVAMRVALVQLDAREVEACAGARVPAGRIAQLLGMAASHDAHLAVFPESYPFFVDDSTSAQSIEIAIASLEAMRPHPMAFIVGGYVTEGGHLRNPSFLVHEGKVQARYFKRVPWSGEAFLPGETLVRWEWNGHRIIPLICADVCVPWNDPDGLAGRMLGEAVALGAGPSCPIVVSTFGADLRRPYWTGPLRAWARACNAPVLVSAIAGRSRATFDEQGELRHYGGGGSGMFWYEDGQDHVWPRNDESEAAGVFLLDTVEPKSLWLPLDP